MTSSYVLQLLARDVRRDTLQILAAAEERWLTWAPPGTSNHILWHAGHALWVQDALCIELLTGRSELPPGWGETFGMNCMSPRLRTAWPNRDELVGLLEQQLPRIVQLLESAADEQLAATADPTRGPASIAARIAHGLHDEAKHCGEMYLLLKMCRAGTMK